MKNKKTKIEIRKNTKSHYYFATSPYRCLVLYVHNHNIYNIILHFYNLFTRHACITEFKISLYIFSSFDNNNNNEKICIEILYSGIWRKGWKRKKKFKLIADFISFLFDKFLYAYTGCRLHVKHLTHTRAPKAHFITADRLI